MSWIQKVLPKEVLEKQPLGSVYLKNQGDRMRIFEEWEGIAMLLLAIFLVFAALGTKLDKWLPGDPTRLNPRKKKK